ncbi:MAG: hypothetical protein FGM23_04500 [Alphaproteobacteria bacterium]|nr:hypothetical protein [Alphaproteobacteria bacterium]
MSILEAAKKEKERIIKILQMNQDYCKLQAVEQLIAQYSNNPVFSKDTTEPHAASTMDLVNSKQSRVIAAATEYIKANADQANLSNVHEFVQKSVQIEKRRLSILMSVSPRLKFNRATKLWELGEMA